MAVVVVVMLLTLCTCKKSVRIKDGNPVTSYGQCRSTSFNNFETSLHAHLVLQRFQI